jgi:hypothetical protein
MYYVSIARIYTGEVPSTSLTSSARLLVPQTSILVNFFVLQCEP